MIVLRQYPDIITYEIEICHSTQQQPIKSGLKKKFPNKATPQGPLNDMSQLSNNGFLF